MTEILASVCSSCQNDRLRCTCSTVNRTKIVDNKQRILDKLETKDVESAELILNGAALIGIGNFRPIYAIEPVDEDKKIWRGRPIPTANEKKHPALTGDQDEHHWIYFHRHYDKQNDWDRLYFEHEFTDLKTFGVPFILIPKEKILFAYDEAPKGGLLTVRGGKVLGGGASRSCIIRG